MKKLTKKEQMYENINVHGQNLNNIFETNFENVKLSKKLFSLENKAHYYTTKSCNDGNDYSHELNLILQKVKKILNCENTEIGNNLFINGDCRGYAIKLNDDYVRKNNIVIHRDFGGYGILAPDFN